MRRASQLIITSVKDFRHSVIRNAAKDAHINQINVFYMPICAKRFSSIPDSGGSFAHLPATAASDTEGDSGPSTSNSPSINTKHRSATELVWPMSRQQEKCKLFNPLFIHFPPPHFYFTFRTNVPL